MGWRAMNLSYMDSPVRERKCNFSRANALVCNSGMPEPRSSGQAKGPTPKKMNITGALFERRTAGGVPSCECSGCDCCRYCGLTLNSTATAVAGPEYLGSMCSINSRNADRPEDGPLQRRSSGRCRHGAEEFRVGL